MSSAVNELNDADAAANDVDEHNFYNNIFRGTQPLDKISPVIWVHLLMDIFKTSDVTAKNVVGLNKKVENETHVTDSV